MHYITLDLEWNQTYQQKILAVQRRLNLRLRGEVIQIGAVKLDENLNICGSYSIIVKPKYFTKIHRHVMLLTGITQEKIDNGIPLDGAEESFRRFCGNDFAFLTWGPDDIPMLRENLAVNGIKADWLSRTYDLQYMYAEQVESEHKQYALEYAMEHFGIEQTLPAHDALNDAYFTALVAKQLDVAKGIADYIPKNSEIVSDRTFGDASIGEQGFANCDLPQNFMEANAGDCPICGEKMSTIAAPLHVKGRKYITIYNCKNHGNMLISAKMLKNFDDTYRIRLTAEKSTPEKEKDFHDREVKTRIQKRPRHRPYRKRSSSRDSSLAAKK